MRVLYCDLCEQPIKPNTKKIILMTTEQIHTEENQVRTYDNVQDYLREIQRTRDSIDAKEICPNCYQVLIDLFTLRLNAVKSIEKKILKDLGLNKKKKRTYKKKRRNKK